MSVNVSVHVFQNLFQKVGSGVGSGWDPGPKSGIRAPKVGSTPKNPGPPPIKKWDPAVPTGGFIILKGGSERKGASRTHGALEFYAACAFVFNKKSPKPNESTSRSCLSQTGAGFCFHLTAPMHIHSALDVSHQVRN